MSAGHWLQVDCTAADRGGTREGQQGRVQEYSYRPLQDRGRIGKDGLHKTGWSKRTKDWCKELKTDSKWNDYSLRDGDCSKCGFKFYYRTSYYSLRSSSDVTNYNICANADCKEKWEDFS